MKTPPRYPTQRIRWREIWPRVAGILWIAFIVIIIALALLIAPGCAPKAGKSPADAERASLGVGTAFAKAQVFIEAIATEAKRLPTSEPKTRIVEHSGGAAVAVRDGQAKLDESTTAIRLMAGEINNYRTEIAVQKAELDRLNRVWIAPRMWRCIAWVVGIIALAGTLSVVFGVASPAGIGMFLSRIINANVMMPFVLIRDLINRFRGIKLTAVQAAKGST